MAKGCHTDNDKELELENKFVKHHLSTFCRTANDKELELENEFVKHHLSNLESLYKTISIRKKPISIQEFLDVTSRLPRNKISQFYEFTKQRQLYFSHKHLLGHLLPNKILISK